MQTPDLPAEGGCRCGRLRLRITKAPILTMACHCRGCQRMSSSAYSLSAAIPDDGFEILSGTHVGGGKDPDFGHRFCGDCMTWVFTKVPKMVGFLNLRPTMLDDPSWFAPFIETYTSEKLAFAQTGAVRSFEEFPPMDAYLGLMKDYLEKTG